MNQTIIAPEDSTAAKHESRPVTPARADPTPEEIYALETENNIFNKYGLQRQCPRCQSPLDFLDQGTTRTIQCSKANCISAETSRCVPLYLLPKFVACGYALFNGEDLCADEPIKIIVGEEPGFSELITLKPDAPQWAIDEYETLRKFYDGEISACEDSNGNKYGITGDNQRKALWTCTRWLNKTIKIREPSKPR